MMNLAVAIAHFLNCFLYSGPVTNPSQGQDEVDFQIYVTKQFF